MPVRNLSPLVTQQRDFLGICVLPGSKNSHWRLIGCSWGWLRAKALDIYSCNHSLEEPNSHCLLDTKHISVAELPGPSAVEGNETLPFCGSPGSQEHCHVRSRLELPLDPQLPWMPRWPLCWLGLTQAGDKPALCPGPPGKEMWLHSGSELRLHGWQEWAWSETSDTGRAIQAWVPKVEQAGITGL